MSEATPDSDAGPRALAEGIMRFPTCETQRWEDMQEVEREAYRSAYGQKPYDADNVAEAYLDDMMASERFAPEFQAHWATILEELRANPDFDTPQELRDRLDRFMDAATDDQIKVIAKLVLPGSEATTR